MTKKQNTVPLYDMLSLAFVLLIMGVVFIWNVQNYWQSKYSTAMNFAADVWCQDQTYLIASQDKNYIENYYDTNITYYDCFQTINTRTGELKNYCRTGETRHYSTGIYRANESKIECLGEPKYSGCFYSVNNPDFVCQPLPEDLREYQKSQKFEVPM
jgi:hypothetical protein